MRLFIAINLSHQMQNALVEIQEQMRRQNISGRNSPIENLHLTLAFIGEYPDPDDIPLPSFSPFDIRLSGFGAFGDLWWAGIDKSNELSSYVRNLRHALAEADIPFDRKRFSPHITLLRRGVGQPVVTVPNISMTVDRVSLIRSDRGKNGMIYTEIRSI